MIPTHQSCSNDSCSSSPGRGGLCSPTKPRVAAVASLQHGQRLRSQRFGEQLPSDAALPVFSSPLSTDQRRSPSGGLSGCCGTEPNSRLGLNGVTTGMGLERAVPDSLGKE